MLGPRTRIDKEGLMGLGHFWKENSGKFDFISGEKLYFT